MVDRQRDFADKSGKEGSPPEVANTTSEFSLGVAELRALLETASIGIGIDRLDGQIISANASLGRMLGYTAEEILHAKIGDFNPPEYAEKDRQLFKEMVAGQRSSYTLEKPYLHKSGGAKWGRLTRQLLAGDGGKPTFAVGITQDITERKAAEIALRQSEARYRDFAECSADWFFEQDADGILTYLSEGFERATGFSRDSFIGRAGCDVVVARSGGQRQKDCRQAIQNRQPFRNVEVAIRHPSGATRWMRTSANPRFDENGVFTGYQGASTDVTERVQAEQALSESQRLYSSLVESSQVAIVLHQDEVVRFANAECARMLGAKDASEIIGRSIWDFIAIDEHDSVREAIRRRFVEDNSERIDFRFRRLDGKTLFVRSSGRVVLFNGRPALQAVLEDITDELRVMTQLRESEARLQSIVEASPAGIFLKDRDRRYVLVNKAYSGFWEFPVADMLGKRAEDFQPSEPATNAIAEDTRVLMGESILDGQWAKARGDGSAHYYSYLKFPLRGLDGDVFGIGGIVTEITEKKSAEDALRASEALFRGLFDNIPSSASLRDLSGRFILVNREFERWHGKTDCAERRWTIRDYYPPDEAAMVEQGDQEVVRSRTPMTYERLVPLQDGSRITALITKFPVLDPRGEVTMLGTIGSDISARKRIEEELREAKEAAEIANQSKSHFLANMSHELRTPLNSIIGFSQIMEMELFGALGNPKYREYVRDMLTSGRSLLELINDILDLSRVEAGRMTLNEGLIVLPSLLQDMERLFLPRASAARLKLRTDGGRLLPCLYGDERRIKQILANLLSNAIKFTPAAGTVSLAASLDGEGRVVFTVSDTGIGIAEDKLATALSVFGQVEDPLTRSREGAGLGLPLSKGLAELHGASLEIASRLGAGTTVKVVFPAERSRPGSA